MSQDVGRQVLRLKRRAALLRHHTVLGNTTLDGISAKPAAGVGWEYGVIWEVYPKPVDQGWDEERGVPSWLFRTKDG